MTAISDEHNRKIIKMQNTKSHLKKKPILPFTMAVGDNIVCDEIGKGYWLSWLL